MPIRTIIFDMGDTLVVVDAAYRGSMVNWPQLVAVKGVKEMLPALDGKYRLVVGSNASDSDATLVKAAMIRLGLDAHFAAYFTPAELDGARKPDRAFFLKLEESLGVPRSELVMVGDSYSSDITGAVQAGWRAVWYNPAGKAEPGLSPLHSAEITSMTDLPQALENMDWPTISECSNWLVEAGAGANLLIHVYMVAALAYQMAVWLRQAGEEVNPVLAHRGGLLHDLAKSQARVHKVDHGLLAGEMLVARGHGVLAQIADRHVLFNLIHDDRRPRTWEEKLVYFADKLVEEGEIVTFRERLAALQERYKGPTSESNLNVLIDTIAALELEICRPLNWTPEQLLKQLRYTYFGVR